MTFDLGAIVSAVIAIVGFVVWLVRLEGRVNSGEKATTEVAKDLEASTATTKVEIAAIRAKSEADAKAHNETAMALVRVEEQLKHITNLVERLLEPRQRHPSA